MIFEKTLIALASAATIVAAAGVAVVAAAFALYALLTPHLGAAGAAAVVAASAALLVGLAALVAAAKAKSHASRARSAEGPDLGLIWQVIEMAKRRPLLAAGAAFAAAVFAMRNPTLLAALVKAFLDPRTGPPPKA